MSASLEGIERRIASTREIREIFGAMRALGAVRLQEARAALPGTRAYADSIAHALAEVHALEAPTPATAARRPLLVLFMPDHGFVGALAERLLDAAHAREDRVGLVVVGDRGADLAEQDGMRVHARLGLGAHVAAGPVTARRLTAMLERLMDEAAADGLDVLFPRHLGARGIDAVQRRLLPYEAPEDLKVAGRVLVNLPRPELAEAVLSEWLLGEFAHAVIETLASENAARLAAMTAARAGVDARLEALEGAHRVARQEAITREIAEVAAGVLAQEMS